MKAPCYDCYDYREVTKGEDGKLRCRTCHHQKYPSSLFDSFESVPDVLKGLFR